MFYQLLNLCYKCKHFIDDMLCFVYDLEEKIVLEDMAENIYSEYAKISLKAVPAIARLVNMFSLLSDSFSALLV